MRGVVIYTASLIVAGLLLSGWLYWLTSRVQQLLNRGDRQQDVIDRKLALIPSKGAPRTDEGWKFLGVDMVPDRPRTDTSEQAAAIDAGLAQLLDQPVKRRHAAPRKGK